MAIVGKEIRVTGGTYVNQIIDIGTTKPYTLAGTGDDEYSVEIRNYTDDNPVQRSAWSAPVVATINTGGGNDVDAAAFLTASGNSGDSTISSAINTLVTELKSAGVWTRLKAIYPFVGGTAAKHKWNLKDPRDLDAAFRLVFSGTWAHSAVGAKPDGSGFANTFWNPNTQLPSNAMSMGIYLTTACILQSDKHAMGVYTGAANFLSIEIDSPTNIKGDYFSGASQINLTVTDLMGFLQLYGGTDTKKLRQGSANVSTATAVGGNRPNANIYIGALNLNGLYGGTDGTVGLAYMGEELTDSETIAFYNAVQAFHTALGRQVTS